MYNDLPGQGNCSSCPPGYYAEASADGTQSCTACDRGTYSSQYRSSQCFYCPPGEFTNTTGNATCQSCPPGSAAADDATQRTQCFACPLGWYSSSGGTCQECPLMTYSLLNGSVHCTPCTDIDGIECSGGIAFISRAYHGAVQVHRSLSTGEVYVNLTTQRCPTGYCTGTNSSTFSAVYDLLVSSYINARRSDVITLSLPNQCSEHRDQSYNSPLCSQCADDESGGKYAPPDIGSAYLGCQPCDGISYMKIGMLLSITWLLVLVYYMASNGRLGLTGAVLYFMQTTAIMVSSQSSLTAWIRTFGFSPVSILPPVCFAPMSPELQYAIPLFIAPIQVVQLAMTVVLHAAIKRYACSAPIYQLDNRTMTYVMTRDQAMELQSKTRLQLLKWFLRTLLRYRLWPELTVSTVTRTLFLIITASFTSVMVTCISWFQCTTDTVMGITSATTVDNSSSSSSSTGSVIRGSVVYVFPAISCQSSAYLLWSIVMAAYIVVWLLMIGLTLCWLTANRRHLSILQTGRSTVITQDNDVAHDNDIPYDRRLVSFIVTALVPRLVSSSSSSHSGMSSFSSMLWVPWLTRTGFAMYWPAANTADDEYDVAAAELDAPVCVGGLDDGAALMESRREYAFRSVFGALYDSFSASAISWNVWIWLRRLLLILLSVALTMFPSAKYMSFAFLHLIICGLHIYYQPFAVAYLNDFEQVAIVIHIVMAIILNAYSSSNDNVQLILLTLTIAPLVSYLSYRLAQQCLPNLHWTYRSSTAPDNRAESVNAPLLSAQTQSEIEFDVIQHRKWRTSQPT